MRHPTNRTSRERVGAAAFLTLILGCSCAAFANARVVRAGPQEEAQGKEQTAPAPPTLQKARATLAGAEEFHDDAIGYAGVKSATYRAYEVLRDSESVEELTRLTEHKNPIMRLYAFRALAERHKEVDLFPLLEKRMEDRANVKTQFGCIAGDQTVVDLLLESYGQKLPAKQQELLLACVLQLQPPINSRQRLLLHWSIPRRYAPRLREIASEDPAALVALAKQQNPDDLALVEAALTSSSRDRRYFGLWSAKEFPHSSLLPKLLDLSGSILASRHPGTQRAYFEALVNHDDPRVVGILASPLAAPSKARTTRLLRENAFLAIAAQPSSRFQDLYFRYWLEADELSSSVLTHLIATDPTQTLEATRRYVDTNRFHFPEGGVGVIVDLLRKESASEAEAMVNKALARANVHDFRWWAQYATNAQYESSLPLFFERLLSNQNPHIFLPSAEALLQYGGPPWAKALRDARETKEHLRTGWGGKKLEELLGSK